VHSLLETLHNHEFREYRRISNVLNLVAGEVAPGVPLPYPDFCKQTAPEREQDSHLLCVPDGVAPNVKKRDRHQARAYYIHQSAG